MFIEYERNALSDVIFFSGISYFIQKWNFKHTILGKILAYYHQISQKQHDWSQIK